MFSSWKASHTHPWIPWVTCLGPPCRLRGNICINLEKTCPETVPCCPPAPSVPHGSGWLVNYRGGILWTSSTHTHTHTQKKKEEEKNTHWHKNTHATESLMVLETQRSTTLPGRKRPRERDEGKGRRAASGSPLGISKIGLSLPGRCLFVSPRQRLKRERMKAARVEGQEQAR